MLREFKEFIARGNVIDLAIAVVIGAAFGRIVTSLVEGVIMPPIGLLLGNADFSNLFIDLSRKTPPAASLLEAQAQGRPVIAYGQFINDVISFLIIAFVIFLIVKAMNRLRAAPPPPPNTKDCPYCLTAIPLGARRCAACCADLPASA
jgi:large conductance mechanosensitive channel